MNSIDIVKGIVFKNLDINKDSFTNRLLSQKKIFLLQSLGVDLGYVYNWYVHGPYSPALTNYIYNNIEVLLISDFSNYDLTDVTMNAIEKVKILANSKIAGLTEAELYELYASLLYIHKNNTWGIDNTNDNECIEKLLQYKPKYSKQQCEEAFKNLREDKFI